MLVLIIKDEENVDIFEKRKSDNNPLD